MEGAERREYTASLRVFSETLPYAELEARLGKPSDGHDIGDPVSRRQPDGPTRRHAGWFLESSQDRTETLDGHIEELVAFAESHRDAIDALRPEAEIDIYCGAFVGGGLQGGFTLPPSLCRRLGELGLAVGIELY